METERVSKLHNLVKEEKYMKKIAIVGTGFYGLTLAERLSSHENLSLDIFEARSDIGGNAFSYVDPETGIEIHKYGSHLFHTSSVKVWDYVNKFASFNNYKHTVWAKHNGETFSLPINLATINQLVKKDFNPQEAKEWLDAQKNQADKVGARDNFEGRAISLVGNELYKAFYKNYTFKQWQTESTKLPPEIASRLPVRYNYNNDYFNDTFQGLPIGGYYELFQNMQQKIHGNFFVETEFENSWSEKYDLTIYTGPIDGYFDYEFGRLGWRTLDFSFETHKVADYQGTAVMNYSDLNVEFTRIHEFKHLHPEREFNPALTVIAKEFSRFANSNDEPYYPINTVEDRNILAAYRAAADKLERVHFGGRLGTYKYLDMHMAIASALSDYQNIVSRKLGILPHLES